MDNCVFGECPELLDVIAVAVGKSVADYLIPRYPEFKELYDRAVETGYKPTFEEYSHWACVYMRDHEG